ncbi:MAG: ATP-binding protein [Akkermansiaceae bacterium]|nr:ATP-binding protein [Akkermansiaceae bacterium]
MKRTGIRILFLFLCSILQAAGDTWEHSTALRFSQDYREIDARLKAITRELQLLPSPYQGVPTATGGYLSHWLDTAEDRVILSFKWHQPHPVNSVALLPLRLYLGDKGKVTENAYWPGQIEIKANINGELVTLARVTDTQTTIRRSLPELIEFDTVATDNIKIVCTNLTKETATPHYGAGFAEIFIFSDQSNIAPRATVWGSKGREDMVIFSLDYLTNGQTPLGLPEIGPETPKGLGLYYGPGKHSLIHPYVCEITFDQDTLVDAVRLDPAIIHKPGQSFPVRFAIELLDPNGQVIQASNAYKNTAYTNPGLNPAIFHFKESKIRGVRLTIYEAANLGNRQNIIIQLSEITPMLHGVPILVPATFQNSTLTPKRKSQKFEPSDDQLFWTLASVYDGMTQTGKVISHHQWITGLAMRQKLLEEQASLKDRQTAILATTRATTLWSSSLLTSALILLAIFISIRSRRRAQLEIQKIRERIASDLHDETGSNLAAIVLHAGQLRAKSNKPDEHKSLNAILRLSKESVFGLREVLHTTAPRVGRAQNVLAYMRELAELVLADQKFTFDSSGFTNTEDCLSAQIRKDLILFYKEALSNCQKHAQCNEVKITLSNNTRQLTLSIEDDGIGMTPAQLARPRALRTLKQRANRLDGVLKIDSQPGKGLKLILQARL